MLREKLTVCNNTTNKLQQIGLCASHWVHLINLDFVLEADR